MPRPLPPSERCACGYRHARVQHACDKGQAKRKRQGVYLVMDKAMTTVYNADVPLTDVAKAVEFAKDRSNILEKHDGLVVLQVVYEHPSR